MENKVPAYLLHNEQEQHEPGRLKSVKLSFLDKTVLSSAKAVKSIYLQEENATKENWVRKINPTVKLISLIYLAIVISFVHSLVSQLLISAFVLLFFILARLKIIEVYRRIVFLAFIFGFIVVLPASLNIITPGKIIFNILTFNKPSQFWVYNIPANIGITESGIEVVLLVFLRVLNSVSFAMLIVFTTPFPLFIRSFKIIGVPDTFLMIITLAYKYIFILSRTIEDTYFALKSRLSGSIKSRNIRGLISGRIFFIFKRSMIIYENTYYAMVSRGYRGKVNLHLRGQFSLKDIAALTIIIAFGIIIILF